MVRWHLQRTTYNTRSQKKRTLRKQKVQEEAEEGEKEEAEAEKVRPQSFQSESKLKGAKGNDLRQLLPFWQTESSMWRIMTRS